MLNPDPLIPGPSWAVYPTKEHLDRATGARTFLSASPGAWPLRTTRSALLSPLSRCARFPRLDSGLARPSQAGLLLVLTAWFAIGRCNAQTEPTLETGWRNPPCEARLRAYWWWLNGNVTEQSITRDLEQMQAKGFGGAVLLDADGSSQDGNARAPHGPTFFSPSGAGSTNTRCARLDGWGWKSA